MLEDNDNKNSKNFTAMPNAKLTTICAKTEKSTRCIVGNVTNTVWKNA